MRPCRFHILIITVLAAGTIMVVDKGLADVLDVDDATWEFVDAQGLVMPAADEPKQSKTHWNIVPEANVMRPPSVTGKPSAAIRTDQCYVDETVSCDFTLHAPEGQFGLIFGAQDSGHYYWAYYPRWGQNWRARAFYAVIAKVDGNGHARGLAMTLMPNVVTHWNAKLSMKVERRGNQIQMFVNGVRGPFVIDDSYGPGRAGVAGNGGYEVRNFQVEGTPVDAPTWKQDSGRQQVWFTPTHDTGHGTIREPSALIKLHSGEILAAITSRSGKFYGTYDSDARVNLYLSKNAGRTWTSHGKPILRDLPTPPRPPEGSQLSFDHHDPMPPCYPWGIRWFEVEPGVIRAFHHGPVVTAKADQLEGSTAEDILTYRDSHDKGLTWGDRQPAKLAGDWSRDLYRKGCWNHIYGFTQLSDGRLLTVFLHGYNDLFDRVPGNGQGTWGTEIAQPYVSQSYDGGKTWQEPVPMDNAAIHDGRQPDAPHGGFSETVLSELPSGRIIALCRPYRSPFSWQTQSDDGGKTWRLACYAPFSIAGGPQMVCTASGYLAVVGRQTGLGLHTSVDGGVNWDAGTLLAHDCWYNGYLCEAEPDVILVFYYHPSVDGVAPSLPRMQRIRITKNGPVPADG